MKSTLFKAGGVLTEEHSAVYIEREADHEAMACLHDMDYLMITEPRQQGKTSLLARLHTKLSFDHCVFAYVDTEDLKCDSEQKWFARLWTELSHEIRTVPHTAPMNSPADCQEWHDQIRLLAQFAHEHSFRIIIALDEIDSMATLPWSEVFFRSLRKFYNQRAFADSHKELSFILAGAFNPRDMIKDDAVSPFNVAKRVRLLDFTLAQVQELVGKGSWTEDQTAVLAKRIHHWTDGQPYLTQLLCSRLGSSAMLGDVDAGTEWIRQNDRNHLPLLLERLVKEGDLLGYIKRIQAGQRIKYFPAGDRRQSRLEVLGIIKPDGQGCCRIRNRLYEQACVDLCESVASDSNHDAGFESLLGPVPTERGDRLESANSAPTAIMLSPGKTVQNQRPRTVTWLHISDLHFRVSQSYNANIVLQALVQDISRQVQQDGLHPDFIAVTGDIAFSGQSDEYALALPFFEELLTVTDLPHERVFAVPGNHDTDRGLVTLGSKAIGAALTDRESTNTLLATHEDRQRVMARFKGYAEFVNAQLNHLTFDDEHYFYVRLLEISDIQVALLGLNSAWLCASDKDKADGLLIGECQARVALDQASGASIKVGLMHHPFDWLREFDQNESAALLADGCDFILHGHLHRSAATQLTSPDSSATILAGGACYETRDYPNMVNWVRLDLSTGQGQIVFRRYSPERGGFWAKDTLTYRNVPDGKYIFALRSKSFPTRGNG